MIRIDPQEIQKMLFDGKSKFQIANEFGVTHKVIKRICDQNNLEDPKKSGKRPLSDLTKEVLQDYIDKGYLQTEIAAEFGVCRSTIAKRAKEFNLVFLNNENQRKRQSEFMKENNPVQGSRPEYIITAMMQGYIDAKKKERAEKLRSGITFKQYAKYARYDSYVLLKGKYDPKTHSIDHIFTIKDCWDNKVPLELVSHPNNLQIIPKLDNWKKFSKSDISFEQFLTNVGVQRLSKSQLSWKKVE